jgi:hypothetical protein
MNLDDQYSMSKTRAAGSRFEPGTDTREEAAR